MGPGKHRSGSVQGWFLAPFATPLLVQRRNHSIFLSSILRTSVPGRYAPPGDTWNERWPEQEPVLTNPQSVPPPQASGSISPSSGHDPISSSQTRRQRGDQHLDGPPSHPGPLSLGAPGLVLLGSLFCTTTLSSPPYGPGCQQMLRGYPKDAGLPRIFPHTPQLTLSAKLSWSLAEVPGIMYP